MHTSNSTLPARVRISSFELILVLVSVTLIDCSPVDGVRPHFGLTIRLLAYGTTLFLIGRSVLPLLRAPRAALQSFYGSYRHTILWPVVIYFLGLVIGSLRGPAPWYALWQTFSDAVVFAFAFIAFGWLVDDLNRTVRLFLKIIGLWTAVLLAGSAIAYLGNLAGWWQVNPYNHPDDFGYRLLMNGPFPHSNILGYVLMTGAFAAAILALFSRAGKQKLWLGLSIIMALGVGVTFARGAVLGTAVGLLGILAIRRRRLAFVLACMGFIGVLILVAGAASLIPMPTFLPKIGFSGRGAMLRASVANLRSYGPLGIGPGQPVSMGSMGVHNFILEQYGDGGILTTLGVLGWLVLPIVYLRRSRLEPTLAWALVASMAGLMVHGLFWSQFLIGLRFLTLVFVCLWTALATTVSPTPGDGTEESPAS